MKNQLGLPCRWIVTDELETMYEVVCERDRSRITHVGKDKVCYRENRMSIDFQTGYCARTIDTSDKNGKFAFTSLGLIIALEC
jgi:hypothetical protein